MTVVARPPTTDHFDAVKAVLVSGLPSSVTVLSPSDARDLKAGLSPQLVVLTVERRYAEAARLDATDSREARRIGVSCVGNEDNANLIADKVRDALEYVALTIASRMSTPVQHETSDTAQPTGEGYYAAQTTYTYRA